MIRIYFISYLLLTVLFAQSDVLEEQITLIKNPFDNSIKKTKKESISKKRLKIYAIINQSLLYKNKWYKKGDKLHNCTILQIEKYSAKFVCRNKKIIILKVNK